MRVQTKIVIELSNIEASYFLWDTLEKLVRCQMLAEGYELQNDRFLPRDRLAFLKKHPELNDLLAQLFPSPFISVDYMENVVRPDRGRKL